MGLTGFPEILVRNYHSTLHKIPDLTRWFGNAVFGLAPYGLIQSKMVWHSALQCFTC